MGRHPTTEFTSFPGRTQSAPGRTTVKTVRPRYAVGAPFDRRPSPSAARTEAENDENTSANSPLTQPRPFRDDYFCWRAAARATGSGDPVLLLNGMSRSMEGWAYFADALQDRTVIAFDAPGGRERNSGGSVLDAHAGGYRCKGPDAFGIEKRMSSDTPRRRGRPAVGGRSRRPRN
jgi:pimeloyl-ACP methyl ester carboxylesterase